HDDHHSRQTGDAGGDAVANRISAERRTNRPLLAVNDAGRKRARFQKLREVRSFRLAAQVGDAALILDLALNGGHADDLVVEDDPQAIVDIGFGISAEALAAILAQGEGSLPLAELVLAGARVAKLISRDHGIPG